MNLKAFSGRTMADTFAEFGAWLQARVGAHKAAITIHRYLAFFMEMEKEWGGAPAYGCMLQQFGAEGLRRVRLPMAWLTEEKGVMPDADAREDNSERLRIEAIVASVPSATLAAKTLNTYQKSLSAKLAAGKMTLRSVRLALRPAASLLLATDPSGRNLPNQATLDRYLLHAPGQKAAVTGFVNILNRVYGTGLIAKVDAKRVATAHRQALEAKLIALARDGLDEISLQKSWLPVALAYFHRLPCSVGKAIRPDQITITEGDGMTVVWNGQQYWVPVPVSMRGSVGGRLRTVGTI
jgi:hypothetical protein